MPVRLEDQPPAAWESWCLLFDLAREFPTGWTVVGGQMVQLLAAEHGAADRARVTEDVDVLVDVRAERNGTERLGRWLQDRGFLHAGQSRDGIGPRYARAALTGPGQVAFDVLAPDGLGARANLLTAPPARTVEVPGGTQALARTEVVRVTATGIAGGTTRSGNVRRPTIIAAVVSKAAATRIAFRHNPDRDWQDAALLLSLLPDPITTAGDLSVTDRRRLAVLRPLADRRHVGWNLLGAESHRRGVAALELLTDLP